MYPIIRWRFKSSITINKNLVALLAQLKMGGKEGSGEGSSKDLVGIGYNRKDHEVPTQSHPWIMESKDGNNRSRYFPA